MTTSRFQAALARWGWLLPVLALVLLLGGTFYLDRQNARGLEAAKRDAAATAEREASNLAEIFAAQVGSRVGALAAAKLQFTAVEDSLSRRTFATAVDSVIAKVSGLAAVNVLTPDEAGGLPTGSLRLGRFDPFAHPGVPEAYHRALATRAPAATPVLDMPGGRRFLVFDVVAPADSAPIQAVLAAELEPLAILRSALDQQSASLGPAFYTIYDPDGRRITTVPAPEAWPRVQRPVRVADSEWRLVVAHQPVNERPYTVVALAIRIAGLLLAFSFAISLTLLWRTVASQQEEIARRRAAEEQARENATEAAARARQARRLTEQLEGAQQMSLRLSSLHELDEVVEEFLGGVAAVLGADVAQLYTFDEDEEDAVVGRKRIVLNPELPNAEALTREDFSRVRVPVALMRHLAEPVATGKPFMTTPSVHGEGTAGAPGVTGPSCILTIPLTIGGHLIGLAVWERFVEGGSFDAESIPFAQAVGAHAGAMMRAAELLENIGQAKERASKEAVRLATVLDQLSDGVVLFDADGKPELVNAAAEALLGMRLGKTPAQEWIEAFRMRPGQRRGPDDFIANRALQGERMRDVRFTVVVGGVDRYIAASAAPVLGEDRVIRGAAVVLRDVTDEHEYAEMLRHTNQQLRQQATVLERVNDELRAATAAKDQFLAMMSHELRTPINAIIGYADLLDAGVHGDLEPQQRTMVARVLDTSSHLLGLVNDLLDLTKVASGRIELKFDDVPIERVVRRAADQIAPLAREKDVRVEVDGDTDLIAVADETRLSQILINLASNAVKFTDHGRIRFEFGRGDDGRACIVVSDTGVGIPADEQMRVFDEFYQVDSGLDRNVGGSGLGLAISRRLARLMGGEITLSSEPGVGSEFSLSLPQGKQAAGVA